MNVWSPEKIDAGFASAANKALLAFMLMVAGCSPPESQQPGTSSSANAQSPTAKAEVLFEDDFSNVESGWEREHEDYQTTDYGDGVYTIAFHDTGLITRVAYPGEEIENGRVEVDARTTAGTTGVFGLYARFTGDGFLRCVINDRGEAALDAPSYEDYVVPSPVLTPHPAVTSGVNRIAMSFVGEEVACSVNGVEIGRVEDPKPSAGALGLVASNEEGTFAVEFDDFFVTRP
jgi:hypothetical protein